MLQPPSHHQHSVDDPSRTFQVPDELFVRVKAAQEVLFPEEYGDQGPSLGLDCFLEALITAGLETATYEPFQSCCTALMAVGDQLCKDDEYQRDALEFLQWYTGQSYPFRWRYEEVRKAVKRFAPQINLNMEGDQWAQHSRLRRIESRLNHEVHKPQFMEPIYEKGLD